MHRTKRFLVVGLLALAIAALTAATAGARYPISGVVFRGDPSNPTVTINGSGFGKTPPKAYPAGHTSCGDYDNNGSWYGKYGLWYLDNTNSWAAGQGNADGGNCIGIVLQSWTPTQVVFTFGSAYGTFDHWTIDPGDNFVISVKNLFFGGVVSYS